MKLYLVYPFQLLSGIIVLLALLWLTMGASFVYVEQQKQENKISYPQSDTDDCEQTSYPFTDNTEEKILADEYLRGDVEQSLHMDSPLKHSKCYYADAFVTIHCESVSPPPKTIS